MLLWCRDLRHINRKINRPKIPKTWSVHLLNSGKMINNQHFHNSFFHILTTVRLMSSPFQHKCSINVRIRKISENLWTSVMTPDIQTLSTAVHSYDLLSRSRARSRFRRRVHHQHFIGTCVCEADRHQRPRAAQGTGRRGRDGSGQIVVLKYSRVWCESKYQMWGKAAREARVRRPILLDWGLDF